MPKRAHQVFRQHLGTYRGIFQKNRSESGHLSAKA